MSQTFSIELMSFFVLNTLLNERRYARVYLHWKVNIILDIELQEKFYGTDAS